MAGPKVLFIITRLERGGAPEVVLKLARELSARGWSISIATGPTSDLHPGAAEFPDETGIPLIEVPYLCRNVSPLRDLAALLFLYRLIRKERPDVVHTHTAKAGFVGRLAARLAGCKAIVHSPHGHVFYGYFGSSTTRFFILLEKLAARWCDRITTLTELGKREHINLGIGRADQFVPIPIGVEIDRLTKVTRPRNAVRAELGVEPTQPLVGWVGRLTAVKGCDIFVEAAAKLVPRLPGCRFVVVGDGELRPQIESQVRKLGLSANLILTGNRSDIPDLFRAMDVFVLSSVNEGLGRVILEAMACGTPVVATRVGGVPEVVLDGRTGVIVPPADPQAIADAVFDLISDTEKARKLAAAASQRLPQFDFKQTVSRFEQVYRELLGR